MNKPKDRWGKGVRGFGWQILDGMLRASPVRGSGRSIIPIDRIDVASHGDGHREGVKGDFTIVRTSAGVFDLDVPLMEVLAAMAELRGGDYKSVQDFMGDGPRDRTNAAIGGW